MSVIKLVKAFSVPVDDVPDGVSVIILTHFPDFTKFMDWLKKAETEKLEKKLDE